MGNGKNGVIGLAACSHLIRPWGRAVSLHDGTARQIFHDLRAMFITCFLVHFVKQKDHVKYFSSVNLHSVLDELICLRPMCLVSTFKLTTLVLLRITANEILCTIERFKFKFFSY